jgi:hypothetical protein
VIGFEKAPLASISCDTKQAAACGRICCRISSSQLGISVRVARLDAFGPLGDGPRGRAAGSDKYRRVVRTQGEVRAGPR